MKRVRSTNADWPSVNNVYDSIETVPEKSSKFIGNDEEKNWIGKALENIKNAENRIGLLERISYQVGTLSTFTPDQILRLVSLLDQWIKREPEIQAASNYLCQEVAALIIKKDFHSFENFLKESREKNLAIQVVIQLVVKRELLPLNAVHELLKYGIDPHSPEGQQALIEIAKLAAQQNGWETSNRIDSHGINGSTPQGQRALIEIAKLAAQQSGWGTSLNIENYGIDASTPEGQQALIEIAKLAAQHSDKGISALIKRYRISASTQEGQRALIEIAKLSAQKNGWETSMHIDNYGIETSTQEGQQAMIEIAKLAARKGRGISALITRYGIKASSPEGRQALIEIAKLAAQQDAHGTLEYLDGYSLERAKQPFKDLSNFLFLCLIKQSTLFSYSAFKATFRAYVDQRHNGDGRESYHVGLALFDSPLAKLKAHDREGAFMDCLQIGATLFKMDPADLLWVQNSLSKVDNEADQTEFLEWWMCVASLCASREDLQRLFRENQSLFEWMSTLSFDLTQPIDLRTTVTREVLASFLETKDLFLNALKAELSKESSLVKKIAILPHDLRLTVAEVFIRGYQAPYYEMWENLKKETADVTHARFACLILSQYPKGDYTSVLGKIKSDRSLRDAKHQQPLLETLLAIKNCALDDDAKIDLLNKVFAMPDKELQTGFRLVIDILNFKGEAYLRGITGFRGLKSVAEKLIADKCKVQLDNFTALYENTVGTWRSKDASLTYAGKQTADPTVLPYFQTFLTSVLKDNFQTTRYAIDKNPHLAEIKQHYPQVFENWKLSAVLKDEEVSIKETKKAIPVEKRMIETLKQAVENRHLGLERQEALFPIVAACKGKWEQVDKPRRAYRSTAGSAAKPPARPRRNRTEAAPDAPKNFVRAYQGSQRRGKKVEYSQRDQNQRP